MTRWSAILACAALTLAALAGAARAGSCGFHGYSYGGHGRGHSYDHGRSYHGYSSYYPGSHYWAGGYYGGDAHYGAGYYAPGYYANHGGSYSPCHQEKVYVQPYFIKQVAVVPLVEQAAYGAYYAAGPSLTPAPYGAPNPAQYNPAQTSMPSAAAGVDSKLDKILTLTEQTSGRLARLEARVGTLEGGGRPGAGSLGSPAQAAPPPPPGPPEAAQAPAGGPQAVLAALHARCAGCHEARVSARRGGKFTLFVADGANAELAVPNAEGKPQPLPAGHLRKVVAALTDGTMPPEKDAEGRAVPRRHRQRPQVTTEARHAAREPAGLDIPARRRHARCKPGRVAVVPGPRRRRLSPAPLKEERR
jgi:hypothetical protein